MTKKVESYYFEQFQKVYSLPDGKVRHVDKPDFIIDGDKKIGIEVTNAYIEDGTLPKSEQNQRKGREEVVLKAQQQYLEKNGKHIEIAFSFDKVYPILDKRNLIKKIVALAERVDALETGEIRRNIYQDIPELNFVYVNSRLYNNPEWRVFQVYTGSILTPERIAEKLAEKEKKAARYEKCDEYWLLIIVDFIDRAQDQELPTEIVNLNSNIFKKIIIYKTVFNQVLEISLSQNFPSSNTSLS